MYGWHQNGGCSERILIREKMPNGTYRTVKHPSDNHPPTWELQLVVKYAADGSKYLHLVAEYPPCEYEGPR